MLDVILGSLVVIFALAALYQSQARWFDRTTMNGLRADYELVVDQNNGLLEDLAKFKDDSIYVVPAGEPLGPHFGIHLNPMKAEPINLFGALPEDEHAGTPEARPHFD